MVDEMMTLLETEQVGEDNKKTYYVKSFDERDDEAKAPTRQIIWQFGGSRLGHSRPPLSVADIVFPEVLGRPTRTSDCWTTSSHLPWNFVRTS